MAHTPGKMTFGHMGDEQLWIGVDHEQTPVATVPWDCDGARYNARENAARICQTWNAHDDMVMALRMAVLAINATEYPLIHEAMNAALVKAGGRS